MSVAVLVAGLLLPLLSRSTTAVQESDPEIQAALAAMNLYRSWLGLEPMVIDPALQAAAEAHAEYYRLNFGDPNLSGMGLHMETPGLPGFTGATMSDRASAHGYQGSVNENVGLSGSILASLDWFMDTINHRLPIIDPRYTDVGIAAISDDGVVFEIINFGMPSYSANAEPAWVVWPPHRTTGVGRSFWGEAPNPFPGATFPTGLPVTLSFFGPGEISLESWSITANAVEVPSFGGVGSGFLSGRAALITAAAPLEYGTTYSVQASGVAGGEPFSWNVNFTTKSDDLEEMARDGEAPPGEDSFTPPVVTPVPEPPPPPTDPILGGPTGPVDPDSQLPAGIQNSPQSVQMMWWDLDGPVYRSEVERSWLWGMDAWASGSEDYAEASDGTRDVYYFDKARVEVSDETAELDPDLLTTGLLVRDMISGMAQVGDSEFVDIGSATIPLAGDPKEFNENAPTYASLIDVATVDVDVAAVPSFGRGIVDTISLDGHISENASLGDLASYGSYFPGTGHNIAAVFEGYFTALPVAWWEAVGLPITEPYWARVKVRGEGRWVLVQAFERRLLTFTPSNALEWQVEMGNVGRHYFTWRYGVEPPASP